MFDPTINFDDRYNAIRALCAGQETDELSDATIDLLTFSGAVTIDINERYPEYLSLSQINQNKIKIAFTYLVSAKLCVGFCKGRVVNQTDNKVQAEIAKIDWDALARELKSEGEAHFPDLDDPIVFDRNLILAPSAVNPVTLENQYLISG